MLASFGREGTWSGLLTAFCLAVAALSMALSQTHLCGLSPLLAVLSSFGLGLGFMIIGFLVQGATPLVGIVGAAMAFAALATVTRGATICKQEAGKRMDKPLRVASLLLAMYALARILIRALTLTYRSVLDPDLIIKAEYDMLLLFLSAVGVMLSLTTRRPKANTALSSVVGAAFVVGAILLAGAALAWYVEGSSGNVLLRIALGVVLLFPSFLRRFSSQGS